MKKKIKLLVTIISLCLTVSLFTFIVYAVTQVNYRVSGNVTYKIKDVLATITLYISKANTHRVFNSETAKRQQYRNTVMIDEYCTYKNNQIDPNKEYSPSKLFIDLNESSAWRVTIKIETINNELNIENTSKNYGLSSDASYGISVTEGEEIIYKNAYTEYYYYIYLKDSTKSIPNSTFNISLILSLTS